MLLQLGLAETRPLLRRVMLWIIPLMVMTIVATHSRGAFLAMAVSAMLLVWRSRNRVAGFAVLILFAVAGAIAAPKSYTERLSTIGSYEQDSSAVGRIEAWKVAGRMIAARPLLGVGFAKFQQNYRSFDTRAMADDDGSTGAPGTRVAHNSYLQIWAECGTPAFMIYLALIALSFIDLAKIRRQASQRYHTSWILSYTTMFEASLLAFVVGSFFLNRAQFDLFYHFVAIIIVFGRVAREAMADPMQYPDRGGERGQLVFQKDQGFGSTPEKSGFRRVARKTGFGKRPALGSS
jgi:probable O-glycosylation ligase (exosortase A-associated)